MRYRMEGAGKLLGQRILERRKERGWSQEQLADKAGKPVDQTTISRLERGLTADPGITIVMRIAAALEVSIENLTAFSDFKAQSVSMLPDPRPTAEDRIAALENRMVTALEVAQKALELAQQRRRAKAPRRTATIKP